MRLAALVTDPHEVQRAARVGDKPVKNIGMIRVGQLSPRRPLLAVKRSRVEVSILARPFRPDHPDLPYGIFPHGGVKDVTLFVRHANWF